MSHFDRFRAPGDGTLASFFRQLATPARRYNVGSTASSSSSADFEWQRLRAQQGGAKQLEFFDQGLAGPRGAEIVLEALQRNPGATSITLNQNSLGDNGLLTLLAGMKRLRTKAIGGNLQELNLADNGLTDVSLHLLALHLLQPSPHPTSLTGLYITGNHFTLASPELAAFLGTAISSPASSLRSLNLTNNPIGSSGLLSLLSHLDLSASQLSQLHLSVCGLQPDSVEPLARWLEDEHGGARLQVLGLNGNELSEAGIRRIARSVYSNQASGLIHLEVFGIGELEGDEWIEVVRELEEQESEEDRERWKEKLEVAKERNKLVYKETRLAALGLLAKSRVMFGGNPHEPEVDVQAIRRGVEVLNRPDEDMYQSKNDFAPSPVATPPSTRPFPFLRLPIELQVHILRCTLFLRPSTTAHLYPSASSQSQATSSQRPDPSSSTTILSSPLTENQFLRVLSHCASNATLTTEIRLQAGQVASLNGFQLGRRTGSTSPTLGIKTDGSAWEDWVLRETGCDKFERG